jgi:photosystem II stability/assembly factor-like uncharacterized protein
MMRFFRALLVAILTGSLAVTACKDEIVQPKVKKETGWSALPLEISDRKVQCIAIHPDQPATLYAGLFDGLYKSTDSGANWHAITTGLLSRDIKSVEIVADQPQIVYCGSTGFGLSRSEDGGESWSNMKGKVANTLVNKVHLVGQRDAVIWLATATGIYRKASNEADWTNTFLNSRLCQTVTSLPGDAKTLVSGLLYTGFARTTNDGGRWYYVNNGVAGSGSFYDSAIQFGFAGADSSLLYAVTVDGACYESGDGGQTWQHKYYIAGNDSTIAMVTHPKLRDRLYLAQRHRVFRSTDRGAHWSEMSLRMPQVTVTALQVANGDPGVVYIGTAEDGIYHYSETH